MGLFFGGGLPLGVFLVCCLALFLPAFWLVLSLSRKRNKDGSFRTRGAPTNVEEEETDWILPFQKLENLPKGEYIRNSNCTEISVDILPHESVYGTMHLSLSSYYSRVYKLQKCAAKDIATLKIAFSRALGSYPIMAGRCRKGLGRHRTVVLPTDCLVSGENSKYPAIGPHESPEETKQAYGVPFRVFHTKDDDMSFPAEEPLSPLDAAKYSVYEDPREVMKGNGPICTVCVYLFPDGSATLALIVSHAVMDGVSIAGFEQVWAEESRKLFEVDPPSESADDLTTCWYHHQKPLTLVPPVQRSYIPGPFTDMEAYKAAQTEFFGKVFDDGPSIEGTWWQQFVGWLMIGALLPYLRFFDDFAYLWEKHPDQYRPAISISKEKIQELKEQATPSKPDWIASQDAVVAVLAKKLIAIRKQQGWYTQKRLRLVLFRDARPFVGITPNHAYGLGVLNWPITIDNPDTLSLSEMAVQIRKGLLAMQDNEKGLRFWRLTTTVFERRRWAFLRFVHQGLYDEGSSDACMMVNNSLFSLPDFGGDLGQALSLTTSAGPSIMLPQPDGGCRLFIEKELANVLTNDELEKAFA